MDIKDKAPSGEDSQEYKIAGQHWINGVRHLGLASPDVMARYPEFPVHENDVYIRGYPKTEFLGRIGSTEYGTQPQCLGNNLPNGKVPDDYTVPEENWIHGVRYTAAMTPGLMARYPEFPFHKDDVYICSYPKSGTIWTTTVVSAILRQDDLDSWLKEPLVHFTRHIEVRYEDALKLQHPSCFYTHLPYHMLPTGVRDKDVKIVHISRDPKDVAVSYYHFHKNMTNYGPWNGSWDVFYDNFISGQVAYGSYFSFVRTYWEQKNNPNVMNITYEYLKLDPKTWIGKLAEFLGKPLDPEKLEKIVELTSFSNMKKTPTINIETYLKCETEFGPPQLTPGGSFLRKGVVGDWRHLFTEEQRRQTDGLYRQLCKDTEIGILT